MTIKDLETGKTAVILKVGGEGCWKGLLGLCDERLAW